MRLFLISSFIFILININKAISDVLPNDLFSSVEVVELQMSSLQTNSIKNNSGIYQCWLFAHPENKNKAAYSVNVDAYDNKRYNLTWLLEKASVSKDCKNCWMTTAVTQPQFIGQLN